MCVSVLTGTLLRSSSQETSIIMDSVWQKLMRQRSLHRKFGMETASLVIMKQYSVCLPGDFSDNSYRGANNDRGNIMYTNICAPLTWCKTARSLSVFFFCCMFIAFINVGQTHLQCRQTTNGFMVQYSREWHNLCHRWHR